MDDILAARSQMAMSLGFHIIFAAIGIAMPRRARFCFFRRIINYSAFSNANRRLS